MQMKIVFHPEYAENQQRYGGVYADQYSQAFIEGNLALVRINTAEMRTVPLLVGDCWAVREIVNPDADLPLVEMNKGFPTGMHNWSVQAPIFGEMIGRQMPSTWQELIMQLVGRWPVADYLDKYFGQ